MLRLPHRPKRFDATARMLGVLLIFCWLSAATGSTAESPPSQTPLIQTAECDARRSAAYQAYLQVLADPDKDPVVKTVLRTCNAWSFSPCCSAEGRCGFGSNYCECPDCVDYRVLAPKGGPLFPYDVLLRPQYAAETETEITFDFDFEQADERGPESATGTEQRKILRGAAPRGGLSTAAGHEAENRLPRPPPRGFPQHTAVPQPSLSPGAMLHGNLHLSPARATIIVPFRDRQQHMELFKKYFAWFAVFGQKPLSVYQFDIYFVEQFDDLPFNRGFLFNAGFALSGRMGDVCLNLNDPGIVPGEVLADSTKPGGHDEHVHDGSVEQIFASASRTHECVTVHDVDYLPDLRVDYGDCHVPSLLSNEIDRYGWERPYVNFAGAIVSAHRSHWRQINGFSNRYFGWCCEDDDLHLRLEKEHLLFGDCTPVCHKNPELRVWAGRFGTNLKHPAAGMGRFNTEFLHARNHTQRVKNALIYHRNVCLVGDFRTKDVTRHKSDGLSNLRFHLVDYELDKTFERDASVVFHHVKVKKSAKDFDLLNIPVVLVQEGVVADLRSVVGAVKKHLHNYENRPRLAEAPGLPKGGTSTSSWGERLRNANVNLERPPFTMTRLKLIIAAFRSLLFPPQGGFSGAAPDGAGAAPGAVVDLSVEDAFLRKARTSAKQSAEDLRGCLDLDGVATVEEDSITVVGVNLWGNIGMFVGDDTELAKFYRSIRRHTTDEHALYVYAVGRAGSQYSPGGNDNKLIKSILKVNEGAGGSDERRSGISSGYRDCAARAHSRGLPESLTAALKLPPEVRQRAFHRYTENRLVALPTTSSAVRRGEVDLRSALIEKFTAENRVWDSPTLYETCSSSIGLDVAGIEKQTVTHFLQGCSVGWNITDVTVWGYVNDPTQKISSKNVILTPTRPAANNPHPPEDSTSIWKRISLASNDVYYTQLIEAGEWTNRTAHQLRWDKEAFSLYVPEGDDFCVGTRQKLPRKIAAMNRIPYHESDAEVEEAAKPKEVMLEKPEDPKLSRSFVGSRLARGSNCTNAEEGYVHDFSFGLIPMTENPIVTLCVGTNGEKSIVTFAMVGSCVGKPRVTSWQWTHHVLVFKTVPSGWQKKELRKLCIKAFPHGEELENPNHYIAADCGKGSGDPTLAGGTGVADEESSRPTSPEEGGSGGGSADGGGDTTSEKTKHKILQTFYTPVLPSAQVTACFANTRPNPANSRERFLFREMKANGKSCAQGEIALRAVSESLLDRRFLLLLESEETCPDSFMCPYRVGASVRYP